MKNWYKRASDLFFCSMFLACLSVTAFSQNMFRKVNDFDGDGKADFAITRSIDGNKYWYILQSSQGFKVVQWGFATDQNASGDYDGDGKYDLAIYRKTISSPGSPYYNATFWIQGSQVGVFAMQPYSSNVPYESFPLVQDYSGDGKADFVHNVGNSFGGNNRMDIYLSSGETLDRRVSDVGAVFGKVGDLTGDGKADVFSYNPNNLTATIEAYAYRQSGAKRSVPFGVADDQFVAADFDGDGKGELAIFRQSNGTWWWLNSSDNTMRAAQWGKYGDRPVPADYDGDGKTDLAIWRQGREQSVYWVYGSMGNTFALGFGDSNDTVVTY